MTLGSKDFVGVLQIDSDSIDYVAKFKMYYVAQMYMCLVDTLISCMHHSSMFSAVHKLESTSEFVLHKFLFAQHNLFIRGDLRKKKTPMISYITKLNAENGLIV